MKKIKNYLPFILNIIAIMIPMAFVLFSAYKNLSTANFNPVIYTFSAVITIVFFMVSLFIHTIIHELGHLITGLISNYKLIFFRILKYTFVNIDGKFKLKKFHIPGSFGQCLMAPPEGEKDVPFLLYNLGGIIANLLFSIIGIIVFLNLESGLFKTFILSFILVGIYLAITNAYPFEGIPNDGSNIKSIKNSVDSKKAFMNTLKYSGLILKKDTDEKELLSLVSKDNYSDFHQPVVQNLVSEEISYFIYKNEFLKALELSSFLLSQPRKYQILIDSIYQDKASIYLLLGNRDEIERLNNNKNFSNSINSKGLADDERLKFMYYTLFEKDDKKAKTALENFEKAKDEYLFEYEIKRDLDLISKTLEKKNWMDKMEVLESVSSTNDYLKEKLDKKENIKSVLAKYQSEGRGQREKSFYSPHGGMYLSVGIFPKYKVEELKFLTGRVAEKVIYSIEKALGKNVKTKWINDIVYNDKKVGGILTESKLDANGNIEYIVIGIGLNLVEDKNIPDEIKDIYGSLGEYDVEKATNALLYYLMPELKKLEKEVNLEDFLENYNAHLYNIEKEISIRRDEEVYNGILKGVDKDMDILVEINGKVERFSYNDSKIVDIYKVKEEDIINEDKGEKEEIIHS